MEAHRPRCREARLHPTESTSSLRPVATQGQEDQAHIVTGQLIDQLENEVRELGRQFGLSDEAITSMLTCLKEAGSCDPRFQAEMER